jgi:hypothetical protein
MNKTRRCGLVLVLLGTLAIGGCFLFPNLPPVASFEVLPVPGEPLVVVLDASTSSSPDGDEIEAYMWTFGDDIDIITPLEETKTVTIPVITVKYPFEGEYPVTLAVREKPRQAGEPGKVSTPVSQTITLPHE